jgi:hypothetical protein
LHTIHALKLFNAMTSNQSAIAPTSPDDASNMPPQVFLDLFLAAARFAGFVAFPRFLGLGVARSRVFAGTAVAFPRFLG